MNQVACIICIFVLCFMNEVKPNNFPSADTIIVQKAGKLIMINEKGVELSALEIKQKVFDFVWVNSEVLIYTSLKKNNLIVYQYDMRKKKSKKLVELPAKNKNKEFWYSSPHEGVFLSANRLFVPCDYESWNPYQYFNRACYMVNLKTNKFAYLNTVKDEKKLEEYGYRLEMGKYNRGQKEVSKLLKAGTDCELYYSMGTDLIQISNTPYEKLLEEGDACVSFDLSPNADKVLFTTLEGIGDLAHGRVYIVNPSGTDQQIICSDLPNFIGFASLVTGYSYVIDVENPESGENVFQLKSIIKTNTPMLIMSHIENAKLCQEKNWKYVLGRGGSPYE